MPRYYYGKNLFRGIVMEDEDYAFSLAYDEDALGRLSRDRRWGMKWRDLEQRYGYHHQKLKKLITDYDERHQGE